MELQPYQVEIFFDDGESEMFLSSQTEFIFAEDYDSALKQALELQEEINAQDFSLEDLRFQHK